jgi:hypothetical protein
MTRNLCINPLHGHTSGDDEPGRCGSCGKPAHWDEVTGWFEHDNPKTPGCLLIPWRSTIATPCVERRPTLTTLGGYPRIYLDHRLFVMMIPGFASPNDLMAYENGYAEVQLPDRDSERISA